MDQLKTIKSLILPASKLPCHTLTPSCEKRVTQLALSADFHRLFAVTTVFLGNISIIKTDELEASWTTLCGSAEYIRCFQTNNPKLIPHPTPQLPTFVSYTSLRFTFP